MRVTEKNKSREILVNPSFQETRQLVASKTLRTFISVKICDEYKVATTDELLDKLEEATSQQTMEQFEDVLKK